MIDASRRDGALQYSEQSTEQRTPAPKVMQERGEGHLDRVHALDKRPRNGGVEQHGQAHASAHVGKSTDGVAQFAFAALRGERAQGLGQGRGLGWNCEPL